MDEEAELNKDQDMNPVNDQDMVENVIMDTDEKEQEKLSENEGKVAENEPEKEAEKLSEIEPENEEKVSETEPETAENLTETEPEKDKENEKPTETDKEEVEVKQYKFPLGRVKNIMKMDPDVNMASQDAVFLVTKALEYFVESLAIESYSYTSQSKKKTVSRNDVEKAIDAVDCLAFLEGAMDD